MKNLSWIKIFGVAAVALGALTGLQEVFPVLADNAIIKAVITGLAILTAGIIDPKKKA